MKLPTNKKIKLPIIILASLVGLGIILFSLWYFLINNEKTDTVSKDKTGTKTEIATDKTIHFAAMGDMMAHDTIIANAKTGDTYNFAKFFTNIRPSYKDSNVVFCDQEGLSSGPDFVISGYPSFNAPIKFAADLQSGAGCNLINLANNHMGDKGVSATNATIDAWAKLKPLGFNGANKNADDQNKVSFFTIKGIKFGFVAFADFNNNPSTPSYSVNNYHDEALVRRLLAQARENSDVVIVSMHWGVEDSNDVSADQTRQANLLASLGVDVIIGTGPHVLQTVETINRDDGGKTIVFYSLGNMLSSQLLTKELIGGIAKFDITKTPENKITIDNLIFVPTYMHYEWTVVQAANNDLLARKNAMIYLLSGASEPISRSLLNTTVSAQKQYVVDTLGSEITVQ